MTLEVLMQTKHNDTHMAPFLLVNQCFFSHRRAGGHRREELDLVPRRRVHEEEDRVQPPVPPHRRAVEHGAADADGRRRDLAGDLREQRAEPQQVRLPARRALPGGPRSSGAVPIVTATLAVGQS